MRRKQSSALRVTALAVLCAAVLLPGLGATTIVRQQELRVVLAARHMAEGRSRLVPEFKDEPRLRKPPLMYWLVASAFRAAGSTRSLLAARLPSATAGLLLVLVTYVGGAMLVGRRRAFLGAFAAATSFLFIRHARLAETDVVLSLFTAAAVFSGYRALVAARAPAWWWLMAGLFSGLGFMTKGPAAPGLCLLAIVPFALLSRDTRRSLASPSALVYVPALLILALPWYLAVLREPGISAAVGGELTRTFVEGGHAGPLHYYIWQLPLVMLPFGVLLPFGIWSGWKAHRHRGMKFLLTWMLTSFAALSLINSKQAHYALLLLPPAGLLIGLVLHRLLARYPARRKAIAVGYASVAALMAAVTCLYFFAVQHHDRAEAMVPGFLEQAGPQIEGARAVILTGPRAPLVEFYLARDVRYAGNPAEAWRAAEPGDVVISASHESRAGANEGIPAEPALDVRRGDQRCTLYVKPGKN